MRHLTVAEAREQFSDAIDELEAVYSDEADLDVLFDPKGGDVLYVRDDGGLVSGNTEDMYFDVWKPDGRGWRNSPADYEYWLEGKCDGLAASRTTDWDWRDE